MASVLMQRVHYNNTRCEGMYSQKFQVGKKMGGKMQTVKLSNERFIIPLRYCPKILKSKFAGPTKFIFIVTISKNNLKFICWQVFKSIVSFVSKIWHFEYSSSLPPCEIKLSGMTNCFV